MIYKWSTMGNYGDLAEPDGTTELFQFNPIPAYPQTLVKKETWQPIELIIFEGEGSDRRKTKGLADFINSTTAHILSERAVDALSDLWEKYGELYPVRVKDYQESFFVFFPTNIVDCLDYDRSIYKGKGLEGSRFAVLLEFVFHEDKLGDDVIFTLPDDPYGTIYVNDTFKSRVKASKLKGLQLERQFFDPKPWKSG